MGPTTGVPSGVMGAQAGPETGATDVTDIAIKIDHDMFERLAAAIMQASVKTGDLGHAADADTIAQTGDDNLVGLVEHGGDRSPVSMDDRYGDRIALDRIDRHIQPEWPDHGGG